MSLEAFPDAVEIVDSNFKTTQQQEAAETIAEHWPVDLDRLVEEGDHVRVFYRRVIEQFLGPADADMTFAEIEAEYGNIADWPGPDGADSDDGSASATDRSDAPAGGDSVPPAVEQASAPAAEQADTGDAAGAPAGPDEEATDATTAQDAAGADAETSADAGEEVPEVPDTPSSPLGGEGVEAALGDRSDDVDDQRRAWFAAGFREGILFALENPHLVRDR